MCVAQDSLPIVTGLTGRVFPARGPGRVLPGQVPFGQKVGQTYGTREAAPGVDGETWRHYGETLEENSPGSLP
jgi:hypothetical protein